VIGVHAFCLAGPVVNVPGCLLSWNSSWDGEGWLLVEGGPDCHEAAF